MRKKKLAKRSSANGTSRVRYSYENVKNNVYSQGNPKLKFGDYTCNCTSKEGCLFNCQNRLLYMECEPGNCPSLKTNRGGVKEFYCKNCALQERRFPETEVFQTKNAGCGLRAVNAIPAKTILCEYTGEVVSTKECHKRMSKYSASDCFYFADLGNGSLLDAKSKGSIARFANHSCQPNSRLERWSVGGVPRLALVNMVTLQPLEEITYNYSYCTDGMDNLIKDRQACLCGAPNCSGTIGGKVVVSSADKWRSKADQMVKGLVRRYTEEEFAMLLSSASECGIADDDAVLLELRSVWERASECLNDMFDCRCLSKTICSSNPLQLSNDQMINYLSAVRTMRSKYEKLEVVVEAFQRLPSFLKSEELSWSLALLRTKQKAEKSISRWLDSDVKPNQISWEEIVSVLQECNDTLPFLVDHPVHANPVAVFIKRFLHPYVCLVYRSLYLPHVLVWKKTCFRKSHLESVERSVSRCAEYNYLCRLCVVYDMKAVSVNQALTEEQAKFYPHSDLSLLNDYLRIPFEAHAFLDLYVSIYLDRAASLGTSLFNIRKPRIKEESDRGEVVDIALNKSSPVPLKKHSSDKKRKLDEEFSDGLYHCYCQLSEHDGEVSGMIQCEAPECGKWFHSVCVNRSNLRVEEPGKSKNRRGKPKNTGKSPFICPHCSVIANKVGSYASTANEWKITPSLNSVVEEIDRSEYGDHWLTVSNLKSDSLAYLLPLIMQTIRHVRVTGEYYMRFAEVLRACKLMEHCSPINAPVFLLLQLSVNCVTQWVDRVSTELSIKPEFISAISMAEKLSSISSMYLECRILHIIFPDISAVNGLLGGAVGSEYAGAGITTGALLRGIMWAICAEPLISGFSASASLEEFTGLMNSQSCSSMNPSDLAKFKEFDYECIALSSVEKILMNGERVLRTALLPKTSISTQSVRLFDASACSGMMSYAAKIFNRLANVYNLITNSLSQIANRNYVLDPLQLEVDIRTLHFLMSQMYAEPSIACSRYYWDIRDSFAVARVWNYKLSVSSVCSCGVIDETVNVCGEKMNEIEPPVTEEVFCWCRKPDTGQLMICCDGPCGQWFHAKCMKYRPKLREKGVVEHLDRDHALDDPDMTNAMNAVDNESPSIIHMDNLREDFVSSELGTLSNNDMDAKVCEPVNHEISGTAAEFYCIVCTEGKGGTYKWK